MNSASFRRLILLVITALWLGIFQPAAQAQRDPQTPEGMYEQANKWLKRGYYERAVEMFEKIKTRYPFSQYAVQAEMRIGDSWFERGEYTMAVDAYQSFIKLHPNHAELDYVMYRIAESEYKQAPSFVQRDQAPTRRMLTSTQLFEQRFPDSKYREDVKKMRFEGRTRLARGLFGIGEFYYRRGRFELDLATREKAFLAASRRFEAVLDQFPDVPEVGAEALYTVGLMHTQLGRKQDAQQILARLKDRFPGARQIKQLERRVARMRAKDLAAPASPTLPAPPR